MDPTTPPTPEMPCAYSKFIIYTLQIALPSDPGQAKMYAIIEYCILFSWPLVADSVRVEENSASMSKPSTRKNANERPEAEKVPTLVAKQFSVRSSSQVTT